MIHWFNDLSRLNQSVVISVLTAFFQNYTSLLFCISLFHLGLGKTKRKTSARDPSPTPSTEAEYPSNGSAGGGGVGGAERIYDLNIPALVKFSYAAEREDELSLIKGERVVVLEKCSDGWWRGSHAGRVGWFPSNYVQEEGGYADHDGVFEDSLGGFRSLKVGQGAAMANGRWGGSESSVLHVVQTLYPFSSVTEEELNFEKGETMEVLEKPENDPEWWRCKNSRGMVGLVPKNYVVVLSDGPIAKGLGSSHGSPHISHTVPSCTGKFAGKDWYYGNVSRHQAECALNERGVEGDFLIRDSESSVSWTNFPHICMPNYLLQQPAHIVMQPLLSYVMNCIGTQSG